MKHIIHDWDDERSATILKNIREAMRPGAKVLVAESVVPVGDAPHYSKLLDLEMLASPGGVERTSEEYAALFEAAASGNDGTADHAAVAGLSEDCRRSFHVAAGWQAAVAD